MNRLCRRAALLACALLSGGLGLAHLGIERYNDDDLRRRLARSRTPWGLCRGAPR
jgi:hypothetical protein